MKTDTMNLFREQELSFEEMSDIYGGNGWLLLEFILYVSKSYTDLKKGFVDGLNNR